MKLEVTLLGEFKEMEEARSIAWSDLFERSPGMKEEEDLQLIEKLPKSEGTGRRSLRSRSNRNFRAF
jgi:hypothetical protein